jgi:hypothetical protein
MQSTLTDGLTDFNVCQLAGAISAVGHLHRRASPPPGISARLAAGLANCRWVGRREIDRGARNGGLDDFSA